MAVGVRTLDLRKVYQSTPPPGAGSSPTAGGNRKHAHQPKATITALDELSLEVMPGEIFGLLGPNGAGKSTTVGIITTRVRPTSGQAWIGDYDVWQEPAVVKRLIGVVPQFPHLPFTVVLIALLLFDAVFLVVGLRQFDRKAIS